MRRHLNKHLRDFDRDSVKQQLTATSFKATQFECYLCKKLFGEIQKVLNHMNKMHVIEAKIKTIAPENRKPLGAKSIGPDPELFTQTIN